MCMLAIRSDEMLAFSATAAVASTLGDIGEVVVSTFKI